MELPQMNLRISITQINWWIVCIYSKLKLNWRIFMGGLTGCHLFISLVSTHRSIHAQFSTLDTTTIQQQWPPNSFYNGNWTWLNAVLCSYRQSMLCHSVYSATVNTTRVHFLHVMFAALNAYVHHSAGRTHSWMLKALINFFALLETQWNCWIDAFSLSQFTSHYYWHITRRITGKTTQQRFSASSKWYKLWNIIALGKWHCVFSGDQTNWWWHY